MLELNHDAPDEKRKHLIHVGKSWEKMENLGGVFKRYVFYLARIG